MYLRVHSSFCISTTQKSLHGKAHCHSFSNTFQVIIICVDEENKMKPVASTQSETTALDKAEAGTCCMDVRTTSSRLHNVIASNCLTCTCTCISLVLSCVSRGQKVGKCD